MHHYDENSDQEACNFIYAKLIVEVIDALSKIDEKYPYKSTSF